MRSRRLALGLGSAALALSACVSTSPAEPVVMLGDNAVTVLIADDDGERARGLQGVEPLKPGEGMLFVFDDTAVRTFVMKEVAFPIDVLFIAEDLTVSAIEPLDPGEMRRVTSPDPSRYVVELPQGWAEGANITVGTPFEPPN